MLELLRKVSRNCNSAKEVGSNNPKNKWHSCPRQSRKFHSPNLYTRIKMIEDVVFLQKAVPVIVEINSDLKDISTRWKL